MMVFMYVYEDYFCGDIGINYYDILGTHSIGEVEDFAIDIGYSLINKFCLDKYGYEDVDEEDYITHICYEIYKIKDEYENKFSREALLNFADSMSKESFIETYCDLEPIVSTQE